MVKPYVVVVGTDFTEHAVRALHVALEQARHHSPAELHVVHASMAAGSAVASPIDPLSGFGAAPLPTTEEQQAALVAHLDAQLARVSPGEAAGVRIYAHVLIDAPGFALACLASELAADLMVVGSHGRHGIARWLLGSVAEAAVRQSPCPVLVVPPPLQELQPPAIEPACERCATARHESGGTELWCAAHRERHGRRHTYYQRDRVAMSGNLPLVISE